MLWVWNKDFSAVCTNVSQVDFHVSRFTGLLMIQDVRKYPVVCCFLYTHTYIHRTCIHKWWKKLYSRHFILFEVSSSVSVKQLSDVIEAREFGVWETELCIKEKQIILETYIRLLCMRIQEGNNADFQGTEDIKFFLVFVPHSHVFFCSAVNNVGDNYLLASFSFSYFWECHTSIQWNIMTAAHFPSKFPFYTSTIPPAKFHSFVLFYFVLIILWVSSVLSLWHDCGDTHCSIGNLQRPYPQ